MSNNVKITQKRTFSAHHMLIGAARMAVEDAEAKKPGRAYSQLIAITLCGLAIEAICNAIGDRIISDWKDFESANPTAKLRLLCEQLDVSYDKTQKPWSTMQWLLKQRNAIAHAKPQLVKIERELPRDVYDQRLSECPLSSLEKELSLGNAKRALEATKDVLQRLTDSIPAEERLGLYSDAWEGTAKL